MTVWVPVALGRDIEPGAATGTTVDGASVALWRDTGGTLHAWADRCPHRGMRLSLGFVREDRLVCLYHGWQFDGAGSCRHVPAHPTMEPPRTVKPTRYRVLERSGLAWVSTTDTTDDAVPDTVATPVRSVWIAADRDAVIDHLRSVTTYFGDRDSIVSGTFDGIEVLAGIQVIDAHTTAVHLVAAGTPPAATVNALARHLHEIRDAVTTTRTAVSS